MSIFNIFKSKDKRDVTMNGTRKIADDDVGRSHVTPNFEKVKDFTEEMEDELQSAVIGILTNVDLVYSNMKSYLLAKEQGLETEELLQNAQDTYHMHEILDGLLQMRRTEKILDKGKRGPALDDIEKQLAARGDDDAVTQVEGIHELAADQFELIDGEGVDAPGIEDIDRIISLAESMIRDRYDEFLRKLDKGEKVPLFDIVEAAMAKLLDAYGID